MSFFKLKFVKKYDKFSKLNITYNIHLMIIVRGHHENLTLMLITNLKQHKIILKKP